VLHGSSHKTVEETVAFSTPWFELLARKVDHQPEPFYCLRLDDYVTVIARTPEGRILLVRQYRAAVDRETLEFPSGHVDPGETPEFAALRELEEETGYTADEVQLLGAFSPDTGRLANRMWCFSANARKMREAPVKEEGIEVLDCSPAELIDLIRTASFDHALNVAALFLCMLKGNWCRDVLIPRI
jgi:8-oxo-dGTP pyrophosphatase MutT (NUDIX family)